MGKSKVLKLSNSHHSCSKLTSKFQTMFVAQVKPVKLGDEVTVLQSKSFIAWAPGYDPGYYGTEHAKGMSAMKMRAKQFRLANLPYPELPHSVQLPCGAVGAVLPNPDVENGDEFPAVHSNGPWGGSGFYARFQTRFGHHDHRHDTFHELTDVFLRLDDEGNKYAVSRHASLATIKEE